MKYLDMPEGNEYSHAYEYLLKEAAQGRHVAIIQHTDGCYAYSAEFDTAEDPDLSLWLAAKTVVLGREAARADGLEPTNER